MIFTNPISSRYVSRISFNSIPSRAYLQNPVSFLHGTASSDLQSSGNEEDVETVFRIINSSTSSQYLEESLNNARVSISNELVDRVLKRVRFSHGNPLQTLDFFRYADSRKGFYHTSFSLDTMLYILGRSRRLNQIWEILNETKRKDRSLISPRTVQVVLARIAKVCSVRKTVESFWMFKRLVPDLNTTCFNALLRTLSQEKSMMDARNVYHSLKHQFQPDLQTFNILLSGWKSPDEAESFLMEMKEMGVKPDIVTYNSLINVYCKSVEMEKAYGLVDKMRRKNIKPDVITYTTIIGGLGLTGEPDKAREVLEEMREEGCNPDVAAYNAVIRNFCIAKRINDAHNLIEEMVEKGLSPNPTTYNLFFRVFYSANDLNNAWSLYEKMMGTGCFPNTQSCMFLMRLFGRQERVEMAMKLWNDMVEKGFGSYGLISDVLIDLLCDLGKVEELEKCVLDMVEKGHRLSGVSFRRIKVVMEVADKHEELKVLAGKAGFLDSLDEKSIEGDETVTNRMSFG